MSTIRSAGKGEAERGHTLDHLIALSDLPSHMVNTALANKMSPVRYAFALLNSDQVTIAAADVISLVADGITIAEQAIQDCLEKQSTAADAGGQ